jgi:hypothetical protein
LDTPDTKSGADNRFVAFWERQPGFVYFIAAGDPPAAIKIGISTAATMKKRIRAHQSSNHEPLKVLGVIGFFEGERPMADANRLELELHAQFSRARRFTSGPGNEWFTPSNELSAISKAMHKTRPTLALRCRLPNQDQASKNEI